ncbi:MULTISPECIES: hypothetical protein [Niallia]|uniref:hypothetical protein n=1 Tax=Niallia TaxID=2837506 RepID=UPI0015951E6B|nr:hypothetical protein [Niallia circulans]
MSEIIEKGMYFAKEEFFQLIRNLGGTWDDVKKRPVVTLIQSKQHPEIYWAIPLGNYNHRDARGQARIQSYLDSPEHKIRSCYYHVGKTDKKSIFNVSQVVPVTKKYIDREYTYAGKQVQVVLKNKKLVEELERKVSRILAYERDYMKKNGKPRFQQCITKILDYLHTELVTEAYQREIAASEAKIDGLEPTV